MLNDSFAHPIRRRTILQAGLALGAMQIASPFIVKARAEEPIKFGLDDPFTGTYAELGKNEKIGCELAIEEINAKGGILGRQAMLVSEDSTSTDTGTAVQKAHKLDRARQSRLPARQRQFGDGAGDRRGVEPGQGICTSSPAAIPTR